MCWLCFCELFNAEKGTFSSWLLLHAAPCLVGALLFLQKSCVHVDSGEVLKFGLSTRIKKHIFFWTVILPNRQHVLFANCIRFPIPYIIQRHLHVSASTVYILNGETIYRREATEVSVSNVLIFVDDLKLVILSAIHHYTKKMKETNG